MSGSSPRDASRAPGSMRARASLATELIEHAGMAATRVRTLRSEAPLKLRLTGQKGEEPLVRGAAGAARVLLAAAAAGPLGGDDLEVDVHVGAGTTLVLGDISATLVLPGPTGARSRMGWNVTVEAGATLVWMPEPVIAAAGCDHEQTVAIQLDDRARLLMRDELILGRHGESPGRLTQHLRIQRADAPLYDQRLELGPDHAWRSPAVGGGRKCLGTIIVVDPAWVDGTPPAAVLGDVVLLPLAGPGVAVTTVAADSLAMRRLLDQGLALLGEPWVGPQAGPLPEPAAIAVRSGVPQRASFAPAASASAAHHPGGPS